jgi:DinB superfamily
MNSLIDNYYPTFELYQALRSQLLDTLTDEDLTFETGGENITLGALCRQIGETEHSYIDSFKSFTQDFSYRNDQPGLAQSVARLTAWYADLDAALKKAVADLSEEDIANRKIDRGGGFMVVPAVQLEIYKEALLIFYGKSDIYLKALGKPRPEQWSDWID